MQGTPISFDANSLQSADIITSSIDHESVATKNAQVVNVANANRSVIPYISYTTKVITVSGRILKSTISEMDTFLDIFRGYFRYQDRNLDIGYGGVTRRYIATATNVQIKRPFGLLYADFVITFTCTRPFGRDLTQTIPVNATGRTNALYSDTVVFQGSAPLQQPILTIVYTAVSGAADKTLLFGNNSTGQQITVTRTFSTNDTVVINSEEKQVLVNGTLTDFSGAFPEFEGGAQQVFYTDNMTSRTMNYKLAYYKQWF